MKLNVATLQSKGNKRGVFPCVDTQEKSILEDAKLKPTAYATPS